MFFQGQVSGIRNWETLPSAAVNPENQDQKLILKFPRIFQGHSLQMFVEYGKSFFNCQTSERELSHDQNLDENVDAEDGQD